MERNLRCVSATPRPGLVLCLRARTQALRGEPPRLMAPAPLLGRVTTMADKHQSDSAVQQDAERAIITALAEQLGIHRELRPQKVSAPGGSFVQLDACTEDGGVLVEAYARQGKLKGAQIKKISQDILKLALLKTDPALADSRALIAFASDEARGSIGGWIRAAAEQFGVELVVVEIPEDVRDKIRAAQSRQLMVNVELSADDVAGDVSLETE